MFKNLPPIDDSSDCIRRCGTVDHEFFEWLADQDQEQVDAAQDDDKPPRQAT